MSKADEYVTQVLTSFPDVDLASDALFQWVRHDADVARAFGVHWLETMPSFSGPLRDRLRSVLAKAARPVPPPESEDHIRAREEYVRNFRV